MRMRMVMVGRTERGHVAEGVAHYLDRLRRTMPVEEVVLPEAGRGDAGHQARVEEERILGALRPGERVVLLDERGKAFTSRGFAERLGTWRDQGVREVAFVVGGAFGVTDAVRARADLVLSLSPMTFPHQLVRVLFAEQLFRAFSILARSPYHHD
ncbi:MAG: 23S rRNA (pseudouridine(1915)-N(3))-methyltransferase RlmH [Bacteroidetes bacterium]|nr:23S rRNA (pseudouridine(1915)-N(3))-methyltransferase RlmH [Bacteroidota bacterium]